MKKSLILACMAGLLGAPAAMADLKVGDDAPKIFIKDWVKGEPLDLSKLGPKEVAVVEFWATWCGPCRVSIPHMSELQDHFKSKGVSFIGVTAENKETVEKFLGAQWDSRMRYRVATDDGDKTNDAWMKAAGAQGIPTAFVVHAGKVKWIGHPMDDEFDLTIAKLVGDKDWVAKKEKLKELESSLKDAINEEDWDDAQETLAKMIELKPGNFSLKFGRYHIVATKLKEKEDAAKIGREILAGSENADELNEFAWGILTHEDFDGVRDLPLAKDAAAKAMKLSKEKDASVIDTYARALADTGDLAGAIEWQKKAVQLAEGPMKRELEKSLKELEARREKQKA